MRKLLGALAACLLLSAQAQAQTVVNWLTFPIFGTVTAGDCLSWHTGNASGVTPSVADVACSGGTPAFSAITGATNTTAAMVVGTGASLATTGSGTIAATSAPVAGVSGLGTGVATALAVNVGTAGAPVVNGAALGTPSSGTLTNATGLPFSGVATGTNTAATLTIGTGGSLTTSGTGSITATAVPVTGVSGLGTGVATFLATPSSANLVTAVTGETGSGALVFGTSPSLTSPTIATGETLSFVTGSTQCLHANTSGVVSGTGSDCGAGGSTAFSALTTGTNTTAAMTVGTGGSIVTTGTGTVAATSLGSLSGLPSQAAATVLMNNTGSSATPTAVTLANLQAAQIAANAQACTPTLVTGPTNDFDPTTTGTTCAISGAGITNVGVIAAAAASGSSTFNGMLAGSGLQEVVWFNNATAGSGNSITLKNQSSSDTTAANRFGMAGDLVIPPQQYAICFYVTAASINRWACR